MEGEKEGMSTRKKVAAGAAIGVAVPAAVGADTKLLGNGDDGGPERQSGGGARRTGQRARATARSTASRSGSSATKRRSSSSRSRPGAAKRSTGARSTSSSSRSRSSGSSGSNRTKEQLYKQAKRLKIEGRSSMTKAQLERAISRAR